MYMIIWQRIKCGISDYNPENIGWDENSTQPLLETDLMKLEIKREIRDYELLKDMEYIEYEMLTRNEEMLIDKKTIEQFLF